MLACFRSAAANSTSPPGMASGPWRAAARAPRRERFCGCLAGTRITTWLARCDCRVRRTAHRCADYLFLPRVELESVFREAGFRVFERAQEVDRALSEAERVRDVWRKRIWSGIDGAFAGFLMILIAMASARNRDTADFKRFAPADFRHVSNAERETVVDDLHIERTPQPNECGRSGRFLSSRQGRGA